MKPRKTFNENLPKYARRRKYGVIYAPYIGCENGKPRYGKEVNLCPPDADIETIWARYWQYTNGKWNGKGTPIQARAWYAVSRAIKVGDLVKLPCEECGSDDSVAHHDDYAKPLEVRWLCNVHHRKWHAKNGPGKNHRDRGFRAKHRRKCLSQCSKCANSSPIDGGWCGKRKREPRGICSDFSLLRLADDLNTTAGRG